MNKKFLTAFLFGAAVLASTSTFVSCKDYSDEISDLQTQINNANALHATKAELAAAKAELEAAYKLADAELNEKITALKAASEAKDAELEGKIADEVARAMAKEAAIEQQIKDLDAAHKALLDLKVDKTTFTEEVEKIYAKIAACSETCAAKLAEEVGKLQTADAALQKQIDDLAKELRDADKVLQTNIDKLGEEVAANKVILLTLKSDFEQQKAACEAFQTKITKDLADAKKELNDKIDQVKEDLEKEIKALEKRVEALEADNVTNKAAIKDLQQRVDKIEKEIVKINEELVTLNILIKTSLRSLVFIPDAYYWGVEATEINYLVNNVYEVTKADVETVEDNTKMGGTAVRDHVHGGKITEISKVLSFAAKYHINPASANLNGATYQLITADKPYELKSATEADALLSIVGEPVASNGVLTVQLNAKKPELIKSVPVNRAVTIFATEVTLPADQQTDKKDVKVTSDYATVFRSNIKDLVINHTGNVVYNEDCGGEAYYKTNSGETTYDCNHLFATEKEITEKLINVGQDVCAWNTTIKLNDLVETHYTDENETHMLMTADKLKACGLKYVFSLVGYYQGGNDTSESVHAALKIDEDGNTIFRPQLPKGAKQGAYEETAQSNTVVGRTPVVRVELVDAENGNVYDYGYLMIRIVRPEEGPQTQDVLHKDYTFEPGIVYSYNCKPADWSDKLTWDQVEHDILVGILNNMAKDQFDAIYEFDAVGTVGKQYNPAKNYEAWTGFGTISELFDAQNPETSVLKWVISGADHEALSKDNKELKTAVRYVPKDGNKAYPIIYVVFSTAISRSDAPKATGIAKKLAEYWFATDKQTAGWDEVHTNVLSPEDPHSENPDNQQDGVPTAVKFDYTCVDVFEGNVITIDGITDPTGENKEYADSKLTKNIFFSDKNNGNKYLGINGKTYEIFNVKYTDYPTNKNVDAATKDKKGLYAYEVGAKTMTWAKIAQIIQPDAAKYTSTYVELINNPANHDEIVDQLVNYRKYNDLDVNTLTAKLEIEANNACHPLPIDDAVWDVRFLRPINVASNDTIVQDAAQATQVLNLRDLISLDDWRGVWSNGDEGKKDYWQYYNITSIEVLGAEAGKSIAGLVTTNLDGGDLQKTTLISKSDNIELTYNPIVKSHGEYGTPESYGTILYQNLSNTVRTFDVLIPVKVCYQWGYVYANVKVTIKQTLGGGAKKR